MSQNILLSPIDKASRRSSRSGPRGSSPPSWAGRGARLAREHIALGRVPLQGIRGFPNVSPRIPRTRSDARGSRWLGLRRTMRHDPAGYRRAGRCLRSQRLQWHNQSREITGSTAARIKMWRARDKVDYTSTGANPGPVPLDHYVSQVHLKNFYSPVLGSRMYATRKRDLKSFTPNSQSVCRIEDGSTMLF